MADQQSKFPDLNELTSMANKFYKTVKQGVCEIIDEYKTKRADQTPTSDTIKTDKNGNTKKAPEDKKDNDLN